MSRSVLLLMCVAVLACATAAQAAGPPLSFAKARQLIKTTGAPSKYARNPAVADFAVTKCWRGKKGSPFLVWCNYTFR